MPALLQMWDHELCRRGGVGIFSTMFILGHWYLAASVMPPDSSALARHLATAIAIATYMLYVIAVLSPAGRVTFTRDETMMMMESGRRAMICRTCNIVRPVRSKHCNICGVCIGKFDHHCVWTNNCVAYRNIFIFYMFLSSLAVDLMVAVYTCAANLWTITSSVVSVSPDEDPLDDGAFVNEQAMLKIKNQLAIGCADGDDCEGGELAVPPVAALNFSALFMLLVCLVATLFVVPLQIVHTRQMSYDLATNEAINIHKYPYLHKTNISPQAASNAAAAGQYQNPFDLGAKENFRAAFHAATYGCWLSGRQEQFIQWDRVDMFTVSDVREYSESSLRAR